MIMVLILTLFTATIGNVGEAANDNDILSVGEAIENNSGSGTVSGYIVGTFDNQKLVTNPANFANTNLAMADDPNETETSKILPVQLQSGEIRNNFNLVANPDLVGAQVVLTGNLEAYFGQPGLKSLTNATVAGKAVQPVFATPEAGTIPAGSFVELATNTEGATIYYTVDGTDPANGDVYSEPIRVMKDLTIKTIAKKDGLDTSSVQEFTFTTTGEPPILPEKTYNLKNFTSNKLDVQSPSVSIDIDDQSVITEGIFLMGDYAELHGAGLASTTVTVNPSNEGAMIDFKGNEVAEVVLDGQNVDKILGAENIKKMEYKNNANGADITFTDSRGVTLDNPVFPLANRVPTLDQEFENLTVREGRTVSLLLTDYFSDADGDQLTFTSTLGTIDSDTLTLQLDVGDHIVAVTATDGEDSVTESFAVSVEEYSHDGYYDDITDQEGEALKSSLHEIINEHQVLSYANVWDAVRATDEDPNNPDNVILFYSGDSRSKDKNGGSVGDFNREHVWAKSHGDFGTTMGAGTDIHHLRPTDVQVNSSRGNLDFDNGGSSVPNCDGCKRTSDSFEPPNNVKGDVARMLFYMATRYEGSLDLELNDQLNNGSAPYHGKLSTLLEWHDQDPVDEFELNRNDVIHEIQGNRNPFIDNPDWVDSIWGEDQDTSIYYEEAS